MLFLETSSYTTEPHQAEQGPPKLHPEGPQSAKTPIPQNYVRYLFKTSIKRAIKAIVFEYFTCMEDSAHPFESTWSHSDAYLELDCAAEGALSEARLRLQGLRPLSERSFVLIPLTIKAMIFVGSYCTGPYRNYRLPTSMVFVFEGRDRISKSES